MKKAFPYLHTYRDRHNKVRYYVRRGLRKIPIRESFGTPAFHEAYRAAIHAADINLTCMRDRPAVPVGPRIYFVSGGDMIKIGRTKNAGRRIVELQVASGMELKLLGSIEGDLRLERALHQCFWHLHVRGEWFRAAPELLAYVEARTKAELTVAHGVAHLAENDQLRQ
jgi:hypothetical protein